MSVFPVYEERYTEELIHQLTYTFHGGSGLGWTRADALECTIDEAHWHLERLGRARQDEAAALRSARKPRR